MHILNSRTYFIPSSSLRSEVSGWDQLKSGDTVVLLTSDRRNPRFTGRVDEISQDGRYLWLIQNNGAGRRLFHRVEGYTTFLDSRD
ncbi:hypothetical protein [Paenarthrobacter ureafaciens]|uniref:hypothetical protein n=1 Tax=Paenarthrobacter ureafaciens TaxID=37931 RepID=UPI001916E8D6|nr:hypothetical protein [Paenarthrobacter ureafaciens]QQQ64368.1 hypothetical protein JHQ56_20055 [Paenarthrobacter ureafaciens]